MKNHALSLFSIGSSLMLLLGCFDTARAQNTLTANPSQLTFHTQSGVTNVSPAAVTVTPTSLHFEQGDFLAPSQKLQINGVPAGTRISASATQSNGSGTWLTSSVSGTVVTVSVSASPLSDLGTYNGVVTVVVPGAQGSPFSIPVTFAFNESELRLNASVDTLSFLIPAWNSDLDYRSDSPIDRHRRGIPRSRIRRYPI